MQIKIIAPYPGATTSGMFGADGKEVEIGTELTVDEKTFDLPKGRYEVIGASTEGKTPVTNDGRDTQDGEQLKGFLVKDKGGAWFVITKDGEEVTKSFRKADLDGFETMSDEDKAAFVELHKKD